MKSYIDTEKFWELGADIVAFYRWISDEQNWLVDEQTGGPVLCGNSTGAR